MDRLFRLLDAALGLAFAGALVLGLLSALPGTAHAASEWVNGSGQMASEKRSIGEFQAIAVSGNINLKLRQGAQESLEVRAEGNLLPLLETVLETSSNGKTLFIRWKKGSQLRVHGSPIVDVTVVRLQALSTSGSSDIAAEALKTPQLAVSISGAGDVNLNQLMGDELTLKITGSGDFKASGQVGKLKISVSGSGDVRTEALKADDVSVSIAGSGDASVHADKTLSVSIAGSGDVSYRGEAQVKSSIAGSGSVNRR
jgi:hypothetical protein